MMRFNKSKRNAIPGGINDPAQMLQDLRGRVDFQRGRKKQRARDDDGAVELGRVFKNRI